jgi:hypothetical protein
VTSSDGKRVTCDVGRPSENPKSPKKRCKVTREGSLIFLASGSVELFSSM